jgi:hypothetical protein
MICSKCSEVIRPIVAVDIDGTLADYHGSLLRFADQYTGLDLELPSWSMTGGYDANFSFREWVKKQYGISEDEYRLIKLAHRQGAHKRFMPIFDGARALCWSIRDAGAELWITTTRPFLSLDNVVPDTVEWLRRHEIEYDGMLFDDDKYRVLSEQVDYSRVVAIFDDLAKQVYWANMYFPSRGWLVRGDWNHGVRAPLQCDLDSAADIAKNVITTWKGIHED